jgi:hypothetical protein
MARSREAKLTPRDRKPLAARSVVEPSEGATSSTGAAPIASIDPKAFEDHEGFRETFLFHFTEPKANDALRTAGALLFDLALECCGSWPVRPEGHVRAELQAALADLRHLEGFLSAVGREHLVSSLDREETALSHFAAKAAREVRRIADRIDERLRPRTEEGEGT